MMKGPLALSSGLSLASEKSKCCHTTKQNEERAGKQDQSALKIFILTAKFTTGVVLEITTTQMITIVLAEKFIQAFT